MNKVILFLLFGLSATCLANPLAAETPGGERRCDLITGTLTCSYHCQSMGYDNGFCQQSRMACHCFYDQLPQVMLPRPHPVDEDIVGYAQSYERDNEIN